LHKPFDIISKQIIDADPLAWVRLLGLPGETAELVDTDIAVTAQADRLIRVRGAETEYLLHLEPQASYKQGKTTDACFYNVASTRKFELLVRTVFILLRPSADGEEMSGVLENESLTFRFGVMRVWQMDPEIFLTGPLSLVPLAVVANAQLSRMPSIIAASGRRFQSASVADQSALWLESRLLLGLNYAADVVRGLLAGVRNMKESSTYQEILEEGRTEGLQEGRQEGRLLKGRRMLFSVGSRRFGDPSATVSAVLDEIESADIIEILVDRLFDVESWEQLLTSHLRG
jgi:hypothetical protein